MNRSWDFMSFEKILGRKGWKGPKAYLTQIADPFAPEKVLGILISFKVPKSRRQHDIKIEGVVHNEMIHPVQSDRHKAV